MNKSLKIYIAVLVLLVIGAVFIELSKPVPVNWTPTFNENHSSPYGLKVLREVIPSMFPNSDIKDVRITPYEYLDPHYNLYDSIYDTSGNFLYINSVYNIDDVSTEELLYFASHGNTIFLSTGEFPEQLQDSLGFELRYDYDLKGDAVLSFSNTEFASDSIHVSKGLNNTYFYKLDSLYTTVLGYQNFNKEVINFVKIQYGDGNFYLHTQPYTFTNYHLLKKNHHKYAVAALSYLADDTIFFNSANKAGATLGNSPLRFIFSQPALKWAWYLSLLALLTFLIFNAKRKQRVVPIVKPLTNTTVDFTKTIANLYYETKDHKNIIDKKITYFLEKIRVEYLISTTELNESFINVLSKKSGKTKQSVSKLINLIVHLQNLNACSESHLIELNKLIEEFHNNDR